MSSIVSFVLGTVYRFPRLEDDTSRQLVQYLLPSQIPPEKHSGGRQPGMQLHGTDVCMHGLREPAAQAGRDLWVFFSQTALSMLGDVTQPRAISNFQFQFISSL